MVSGAMCRRFESCQARDEDVEAPPRRGFFLSLRDACYPIPARRVRMVPGPVKVVSEMLGHGNPAITMTVYHGALQHMQAEAAKVMEDALSWPGRSP